MKITIEQLEMWGSCYTAEEHEAVFAQHNCREATPLEIATWTDVPAKDRVWVLLHTEILPAEALARLALAFARHVLPIWEAENPDDTSVSALLDVTEHYLDGDVAYIESELVRMVETVEAVKLKTLAEMAAVSAAEAAEAVVWVVEAARAETAKVMEAKAAEAVVWVVEAARVARAAAAAAVEATRAEVAATRAMEVEWQLDIITEMLKEHEKE